MTEGKSIVFPSLCSEFHSDYQRALVLELSENEENEGPYLS